MANVGILNSGGLGDFAKTEQRNQIYDKTSTDLQKAQFQATSGLKGETYKDIGNDTQKVLAFSLAKMEIGKNQKTMEEVDQRLGLSEIAVNQTLNIMEEFRSRLTGVVQTGNLDSQFQQYCKDSLDAIAQILNVQDGGRNNIFGGNELARPPVDLNALPMPTLGGGISTNYYQGTQDVLKAEIAEGKTLEYGMKADADGFAKSLHALKIGAFIAPDYQEGSNNTLLLRQAMTVGAEATIDLSEQLAAIGYDRHRIETEQEAASTLLGRFDELEKQYIEADPTQSWVKLKEMENQLLGIMVGSSEEMHLRKHLLTTLF